MLFDRLHKGSPLLWAAGTGMTAEEVLNEVLGQGLTQAQIATLKALGAVE